MVATSLPLNNSRFAVHVVCVHSCVESLCCPSPCKIVEKDLVDYAVLYHVGESWHKRTKFT